MHTQFVTEANVDLVMNQFQAQLLRSRSMVAGGSTEIQAAKLLTPDQALSRVIDLARSIVHPTSRQATLVTTVAAAVSHASLPPISSLQSVKLRELVQRVNDIAKTKVLFARTCGPPGFRMSPAVGTNVLLEDSDGNRMTGSFYNFVRPDQDPARIFPTGTYVAVLQPYLKFPQDISTNPPMVRCDHPEGVVIFSTREKWLQAQTQAGVPALTAADSSLVGTVDTASIEKQVQRARHAGQVAVRDNRFEDALHIYSDAMEIVGLNSTFRMLFFSNRAQCYVSLEIGDLALADAEQALVLKRSLHQHDPSFDLKSDEAYRKIVDRMVRALLMSQRHAEAIAVIDTLVSGDDAKRLRPLADRALAESVGVYDLTALNVEASSNPLHCISRLHADYFAADSIEVVLQGCVGGRGIRAKRTIEAGTLLLASKAFMVALPPAAGSINQLFHLSMHTNMMSSGSHVQVTSQAAHRLKLLSASDRARVFDLHSGFDAPIPDRQPYDGAIDMKRLQGIVDRNSFEFTNTNEIQVEYNFLQWAKGQNLGPGAREQWYSKQLEGKVGTGFWLTPSLFNHSCCPNVMFSMVGDFFFAYASRKVDAGEELCLSYQNSHSFLERSQKLAKWGFECACDRCRLAKESLESNVIDESVVKYYQDACKYPVHLTRQQHVNHLMKPAEREHLRATIESWPLTCRNPLIRLLEIEIEVLIDGGEFANAIDLLNEQIDVRSSTGETGGQSVQRTLLTMCGCHMMLNQDQVALQYLHQALDIIRPWIPLNDLEDAFLSFVRSYCMIGSAKPEFARLIKLSKQVIAEKSKITK